MKTPREKAIDYCMEVEGEIHQPYIDAFLAGYKAANEWISVEDELPKNMRAVIVRDNGISPIRSLALFQDNIFYPDFKVLTHGNVTHWRPIEIN